MDNYKVKKIISLSISFVFVGVTILLKKYNLRFKDFLSNYTLDTYSVIITLLILLGILSYLLLGFTNTHRQMDLNNVNWKWKYRRANKVLIPVQITPYCKKCHKKIIMSEFDMHTSNDRSFKKTKMNCIHCGKTIEKNANIDGVIFYVKKIIKEDIGTLK